MHCLNISVGGQQSFFMLFTDGGMFLLKHLSSSMSRLIQTINKQPAHAAGVQGSKTFQRPVMAFVMQRHDLDSLQLGMKQALRKVTWRMFALQVRYGLSSNQLLSTSGLFSSYKLDFCRFTG